MQTAQTPISRDFRTGIAVGVMALAMLAIGYLIGWGRPDNSLHDSAMAWSFTVVLAILAGIGVSAIAPKAIENLKPKGD